MKRDSDSDKIVPGIGVFQTYYQTHQLSAYSPSTVAWISSVETCVIFLWVSTRKLDVNSRLATDCLNRAQS